MNQKIVGFLTAFVAFTLVALCFFGLVFPVGYEIDRDLDESCSINGAAVSCDEYPYARGGLNGVCPGLDDNKTVEDCIKEVTDGKNNHTKGR